MTIVLAFDDWDIYNKSDELIDNKLVKEDLNNQWNNHVSDTIEDFFSQKIESRWNNVLSYLKTIISSKKTIQTRSEFKDELLEFVAIQYARRDENLRELIIDPTIELACTVFESDEIEKKECEEKLIMTHIKRIYFSHNCIVI